MPKLPERPCDPGELSLMELARPSLCHPHHSREQFLVGQFQLRKCPHQAGKRLRVELRHQLLRFFREGREEPLVLLAQRRPRPSDAREAQWWKLIDTPLRGCR
eukprot:gnl/TRDRNA2_/TRDRNA2_173332_c11_seq1.p2 gnl/TRDRNA2_/TRDRNA2_173332_c11~~gnl/TRDRNA2_/TRDRNA2_173332_c11_seq1.p2  ORF type:complete len:103 (-),score=5.84 gnl/TRDRNA2_/TRDRNA2_173332_c11_seq1:448-756(-)